MSWNLKLFPLVLFYNDPERNMILLVFNFDISFFFFNSFYYVKRRVNGIFNFRVIKFELRFSLIQTNIFNYERYTIGV